MNMIVAADSCWGIGRDGGLPASVPTDLKYFREKTLGKAVVMGRRTLESLPGGRGLPGRTNYVLTTDPHYEAENCIILHSEAELAKVLEGYGKDEVFLIGGATLYNRFYRCCDRLYVTKLEGDLGADTFITNIDEDEDYEIISQSEPMTENGVTFRFVVYDRRVQE